jgi:hypothetical protein
MPIRIAAAFAVACGLLFASPAGAMPPPQNLVADGGFESGGLGNWSCEDARVTESAPAYGNYALTARTSSNSNGRCTQTIAVRPDTEYALTAAVRGSFVHLGVTGTATVAWTPAAPQWTALQTRFRTPRGATTVEVYVHGWYDQGGYGADAVSFSATDGSGAGGSPAVPAAPGAISTGVTTSRSAALSWAPVPGASGYRVYDSTGLLYADTRSAVPSAQPWIGASRTVQLQVTAYNAGGESAKSAPVTVTTPADSASVPYAPLAVGAGDAPSADSLWVAWEAVQTATDGYRVYVDGRPAARTVGPAARITGLAPDRTYRVTVTGINERGESPRSRVVYGTTTQLFPSG